MVDRHTQRRAFFQGFLCLWQTTYIAVSRLRAVAREWGGINRICAATLHGLALRARRAHLCGGDGNTDILEARPDTSVISGIDPSVPLIRFASSL